jgi:hypothetical protein
MVLTIQYFAAFFGIIMIYFTYIFFKKKSLTLMDFSIWGSVWVLFVFAVIFPQTLDIFLETFNIMSAIDFFAIFAFIFIFGLVFYLHVVVRNIQKKTDKIVRETAVHKAEYKK